MLVPIVLGIIAVTILEALVFLIPEHRPADPKKKPSPDSGSDGGWSPWYSDHGSHSDSSDCGGHGGDGGDGGCH